MPTIVHFDISVDDIDRAKKFYEELFAWKIESGPGDMPYYFIETTDLEGRKSLGGGMAKRQNPDQGITNFIGVTSIDEYLEKVTALGGKVLEPKSPVSGWGFLAVCLDTENNTFGLWEDGNSKQ